MSLDIACFTLVAQARPHDAGVTDLIDAAELTAAAASASPLTPLYSHHRALASPIYDVLLTDPRFGDATLASCTAPSSAERAKTMALHNPDKAVVLAKQGGTIAAFNQGEWRLEWNEEGGAGDDADGAIVIRWRRERGRGGSSYAASVLRHPDPPISIALAHPTSTTSPGPSSSRQGSSAQLLTTRAIDIYDHNFARLEVADPRGLEIALIASLMTLLDAEFDEDHRTPGTNPFLSTLVGSTAGADAGTATLNGRSPSPGGPATSPRPGHSLAPSSSSQGPDTAIPLAPNELLITPHGSPASYVAAALALLQPESAGGQGCDLIILRATPDRPDAAQKAVGVAAEVKAGWWKLTSTARGSIEGELFQYVRTDEDSAKDDKRTTAPVDETPRRRIQLNEPSSSATGSTSAGTDPHTSYKPPSTLSIILSKDRLPELEPKARPSSSSIGGSASSPPSTSPPTTSSSSPFLASLSHFRLGKSGGQGAAPSTSTSTSNGPRRPPKTMSVRREGRWTPQPVPPLPPSSHAPYGAPPPPPPPPNQSPWSGGVGATAATTTTGTGDAYSHSSAHPQQQSPGKGSNSGGAGGAHHGGPRRLLNKLGFGSGGGSGSGSGSGAGTGTGT